MNEQRSVVMKWLIAAAVFVVVFAVFWPAMDNEFLQWDDDKNFVQNHAYRGLSWANVQWMFTTFHHGHYQPVTWLTLGFDSLWARVVFGDEMDVRAYHLTNNLLHALAAMLLMFVGLGIVRARVAAAPLSWTLAMGLGAVLWGVHPMRVENVAWITERRDLVSGVLILFSVLAYLRAARASDGDRGRWLAISLGLYVLSLLAKVSGVPLPIVLLALDVYPLKRLRLGAISGASQAAEAARLTRNREVLQEKLPFLALSVIFAAVIAVGQGSNRWLIPVETHGVVERVAVAFYGTVFYVWKTLWPAGLQPVYELKMPLDLKEATWWIPPILVLSGLVMLWLVRKRVPGLVTAAVCYLAMIGPVSGLVQNGPQLVADRYAYLSTMGFAVALAAGLVWLWRSGSAVVVKIASAAMVCTAAVVLGVMTWRYCDAWQNTTAMWERVLEVDPESAYAHEGLAYQLREAGKLDEALPLFRRAMELMPEFRQGRFNYWHALFMAGEKEELRRDLDETIAKRSRPLRAEAHVRVGMLALEKGTRAGVEEAVAAFERSIAEVEDAPDAHVLRGRALMMLGNDRDAAVSLQRGIMLNPRLSEGYKWLAELLERQGQRVDALEVVREAMRRWPDDVDLEHRLKRLERGR